MAVEHLTEFASASEFRMDGGDHSFDTDKKDVNLNVSWSRGFKTPRIDGYDHWYYCTDLKKVRRMAKNGNTYAIGYLEKETSA